MSAHYTDRFSREELVNRLIKVEQECHDRGNEVERLRAELAAIEHINELEKR